MPKQFLFVLSVLKRVIAGPILVLALLFIQPLQSYSQDASELLSMDPQIIQSLPPDIQFKIEQVQKNRISGADAKELGNEVPEQVDNKVEQTKETLETKAIRNQAAATYSKLEYRYREGYASVLSKELRQFGYNIFGSTIEKSSKIIVPDDSYVIGPGDKLNIRFWGSGVDGEFVEEVAADGNISVPKIGVFQVAGIEFGKVEPIIRHEAEKYFQGININVSFKELRSVEIYVVGSVKNPGLHVVPAFSTVMRGILSAGGIQKAGTLRQIDLYRAKKHYRRIDLYDLFLKGSLDFDMVLENNDMIFVPRIGKTAAVAGAVAEEAIFELKQEKTIGELVELAGGIPPQGFTGRIYLRRFDQNKKFIVQDIDTNKENARWEKIAVQDGDLLELQYLSSSWPAVVRLEGNVRMPDIFQYRPNMKLSDILISKSLINEDSIMEFAHLYRYDAESTQTILRQFPLSEVFTDNFDMALFPHDRIVILSREEMNIKETVSIEGAVWKPGVYNFRPELKLSDLLSLSGGINENMAVLDHAFLYRYNPDILDYNISDVNLESVLSGKMDPVLEPFDKIVILSREGFKKNLKITISGAVIKPGEYDYAPGLTLNDIIGLAGGQKFGGNIEKIELSRQIIDKDQVKTEHRIINLSSNKSFLIEPYDYVRVPIIKDALVFKTVTITGEITFPGQYRLKDGEKISDLIQRAGGFTEYAYFYGAKYTSLNAKYIQQQSIDQMIQNLRVEAYRTLNVEAQTAVSDEDVEGAKTAQSMIQGMLAKLETVKATGRISIQLGEIDNFRGSKFDFEVENGDTLDIPKQPNFVAVVGSVFSPTAFLWQEKGALSTYLAKSGGPTKTADDDQIYVIRANGEVFSRSQTSEFMKIELMPGDTVVVPEDLDRVPYLRIVRDITDIVFKVAVTVGVLIALF